MNNSFDFVFFFFSHAVIKQEELDYIKEIKEENIKLKETLRFKERELEAKGAESEAVSL